MQQKFFGFRSAAADFPNLKELVVNHTLALLIDQLNLPVFCARLWNLTAIRFGVEDLNQDMDFSPIGSMPHLTELQFYGAGSEPLTRKMIESLLNPNLKKLFLRVKFIEDGAFIRIAEICGANLEIFHFGTTNDYQGTLPSSEWLEFLPLCPGLRELFVDFHGEYPTRNLAATVRGSAAERSRNFGAIGDEI